MIDKLFEVVFMTLASIAIFSLLILLSTFCLAGAWELIRHLS
jgi:hypothetical protein